MSPETKLLSMTLLNVDLFSEFLVEAVNYLV